MRPKNMATARKAAMTEAASDSGSSQCGVMAQENLFDVPVHQLGNGAAHRAEASSMQKIASTSRPHWPLT